MKRIYFIPLLLTVVLIAACGGGEGGSLEAKKKKLAGLRKQLTTLNSEIATLEEEIAKADPSAKAQTKVIPVKVLRLDPQSLNHFVKVQGNVEASRNMTVSPQMPGKITAIYVKEGQTVKAGAKLAQIDDQVMRKNMAQLQTGLELAKTVFAKQKALWDKQIGTEIQYLQAENQVKTLEQQMATLETQLEMYQIVAPIDGTIEKVVPKVGELASPGYPAFRIVNKSELVIKGEFAESYIPYIRTGDAVKVSFPVLNKEISAKVSRIGEEINPMNRTFTVEVALPANAQVKPNMLGEVSVNDQNKANIILLPISAVQKGEETDYVYVAVNQGGKFVAARRNITLGLSQGDQVEVLSGLASGDQLITTGLQDMSEGQEVQF